MSNSNSKQPPIHWANISEAGSVLGIRFLFALHRIFGRKIFSIALIPTTIYYLILKASARNASLEYLNQVYLSDPNSFSSRPGFWTCYSHIFSFCQATLDKLLAWCETIKEEDFDIVDQQGFETILGDDRGQIIVGSHFGNLEFCRGFTSQSGKRVINALVHDRHAENFARVMAKISPESRINLYQVTELDISTIVLLRERLARGEWVFIAGDRVPVNENERTMNAEFLGKTAPFPIGPFILAASLQHPVNFLFAYRTGKQVAIKFKRVSEGLQLSRKNRKQELSALIQDFADELSYHCKIAPLQWFNFFPFWQQATRVEPSKQESTGSENSNVTYRNQ